MRSAEATIVNKLGLHARPSAKITQVASRFRAEIWMTKGTRRINAKSIMGVMMLAAACGTTVRIEADGPDETEAIDALCALIAAGFEADH
ncbi:MAG: HPr family phosphocarrier protein [Burkholderiaceae bacterium]|nr:HPr family phosphocarrier protein [Burkholderiaceae bacterium]